MEITKKDLGEIILDLDVETKNILEIVRDQLDIDLEAEARTLGRQLNRKEILEITWTKLQERLQTKIVPTKKRSGVGQMPHVIKTHKTEKETPKLSRAEFIRNLVREGIHNVESICDQVDRAFNYKESGKSPRTRVKKTLDGLTFKKLAFCNEEGIWKMIT